MPIEYIGTEILSTLRRNKRGYIIQTQQIDVICGECNNIKNVKYYGHAKNRIKSPQLKYMCRSCHAKHPNNIATLRTNSSKMKGKSYTELYGEDVANLMIGSKSEYAIKHNTSSNFPSNKGITWENKYGKLRADEMKANHRLKCVLKPMFGKDNYQFGKPAHKLSGKGQKGYYRGRFFRSLLELSYIVNVLEKEEIEYYNGELKKYKFKYIFEGSERNYFCDFVTNNEKTFIEIKPKSLCRTLQNIAKFTAAEKWCTENGCEYIVVTEEDFKQLTKEELDILKGDNIIELL